MRRELLLIASGLVALVIALLVLELPGTVGQAAHAPFVVDSIGDRPDATLDGKCETAAPVECTFRAAIQEANDHGGLDEIKFQITGCDDDVCTITPATELPPVTSQVIINGYSQFNAVAATEMAAAVMKIEITGVLLTSTPVHEGLLELGEGSDGSVVKGLVLNGATPPIVEFWGLNIESNDNIITGNYIGTNVAGNMRVPNTRGLYIDDGADRNMIGGLTPATRNVISGNNDIGVYITNEDPDGIPGNGDDDPAEDNKVQGNYVGVGADGLVSLPNGDKNNNFYIYKDSARTIIGADLSLGAPDQLLSSNKCTGACNVIDGSTIALYIPQTVDTQVIGNYIGVQQDGTPGAGGTGNQTTVGIEMFVLAGGGTQIEQNVIGGWDVGIWVAFNSFDITIQNNRIGVGPPPMGGGPGAAIPNGTGIRVASTSTSCPAPPMHCYLIGGTDTNEGNIITNNTGPGVEIGGDAIIGCPVSPPGLTVSGNSIFNNGGLGIDVITECPIVYGVTVAGQPLIDAIVQGPADVLVAGHVDSGPVTLEFFSNDTCDPSGYGEGEVYLGKLTEVSGHYQFWAPGDHVGEGITATATDEATANTAEFSKCNVVPDLGAVDIAAGNEQTCAITTLGAVVCWGTNHEGALGSGAPGSALGHSTRPVGVVGLPESTALAIAAGGDFAHHHSCAVASGGVVKCWGNNVYGQLGNGTDDSSDVPVDVCADDMIPCVALTGVVDVSASTTYGSHSCALTTGGGVKCWGFNSIGQLGVPQSETTDCEDPVPPCSFTPVDVVSLSSGVATIDAGARHTCAVITSTGGAKCWGEDVHGELGNGPAGPSSVPGDVLLPSNTTVTAISAGYLHTCALTTSGGVLCWGANDFGQLGDGTTSGSQIPVQVFGLTTGVAAISSGWYHTCALMGAGGVKCWGQSESGQLGDGALCGVTPGACDGDLATLDEDFIERKPVDVCAIGATRPCGSVLGGISKIDAGFAHTCAITTIGRQPLCWGYNEDGQVGDGTTTTIAIPVEVLWDTDRDGCTDDQEAGSNPALGGLRDPLNFWDFYDTPDADNVRDRAITTASGDPGRVVARFGANDNGGADPISRYSDPFAPAPAAPAYHPAFDRGPTASKVADGAITLANDILGVYAQLLHSCA